VFFIGHGGSQIVVDVLQADILERRRNGERIPYDVFWTFITTLMQPEIGQLVKSPTGHGCEFETSLTLCARPDLVKLDRVKKDGPVRKKTIPKATYRTDWIRVVPEGYIGRPRGASPETGRKLIEACVSRLAEIIKQVKEFDPARDA
jgi:creatinine amidohydrolase/Fe(II)-dependent formamide hydrolase-like protein